MESQREGSAGIDAAQATLPFFSTESGFLHGFSVVLRSGSSPFCAWVSLRSWRPLRDTGSLPSVLGFLRVLGVLCERRVFSLPSSAFFAPLACSARDGSSRLCPWASLRPWRPLREMGLLASVLGFLCALGVLCETQVLPFRPRLSPRPWRPLRDTGSLPSVLGFLRVLGVLCETEVLPFRPRLPLRPWRPLRDRGSPLPSSASSASLAPFARDGFSALTCPVDCALGERCEWGLNRS